MEIKKLYNLANNRDITVECFCLPENKSVSVQYNGKDFIGIDSKLSSAQEKVCLAHELGHCFTSGFYNVYSPFDIREKHEKRANDWAIKKLVPRYRFKNAVREGYDNVYSLAEYFGVTSDFMQKAIDYYKRIS